MEGTATTHSSTSRASSEGQIDHTETNDSSVSIRSNSAHDKMTTLARGGVLLNPSHHTNNSLSSRGDSSSGYLRPGNNNDNHDLSYETAQSYLSTTSSALNTNNTNSNHSGKPTMRVFFGSQDDVIVEGNESVMKIGKDEFEVYVDDDDDDNLDPTLSSSHVEDSSEERDGIHVVRMHSPSSSKQQGSFPEAALQDKKGDPLANPAAAKRAHWYEHARITELYLKADWWTLWIGLISFGLAVLLVFTVPLTDAEIIRYVVPQPKPWSTNPLDAWDVYNLVGVPFLLFIFLTLYLVSLKAMGKLESTKEIVTFMSRKMDEISVAERGTDADTADMETRESFSMNRLRDYIYGFIFMAVLAVLAFWLGRNTWCSQHGLGYAVFSILLGMLVGNIAPACCCCRNSDSLDWLLQRAAKDGEYFIKCSLVLLAVQLTVLAEVGGPAMIVSWIGSPIAVALGFWIGTHVFKCKDSLSMLISVGATWCGASAISAIAPAVLADPEDVTLSISVVAFFTIIFTFAQPYIAIAVGMPDDVAGAWIGASVDQTGNVLVSAAIISDEAAEVAGIVKMVLNASLGIMASVVACYWGSYRVMMDDDDDGVDVVTMEGNTTTAGGEGNSKKKKRPPKFTLIMLWDKFPKFTLGFVITSILLTVILNNVEGRPEFDALPRAVSTLNRWWFSIAFVGIGLTTNVKTLFHKAWASGIIQVYLVANTIDILLSLGLSYLAYALIE